MIYDNKKISIYRNGMYYSGFYIEKSYIDVSNYLKERNLDLKINGFDCIFSQQRYELEKIGFVVKDCSDNPFKETNCFIYYFTENQVDDDFVYVKMSADFENKLEIGINIEKITDLETIKDINKRLCQYLDLKEIIYDIFKKEYDYL